MVRKDLFAEVTPERSLAWADRGQVSGRGDSKGSELSVTEGVPLKYSKKHAELGLKGWIDRSSETEKLQSVSPVAMQPTNERAPLVCISCATPAPSHSLQSRFLQLSHGLPMV